MLRTFLVACLLLTPALAIAQEAAAGAKDNRVAAVQELEDVIAEAKRLNNKNAFVNINARAAALILLSDPARGETLLLDLWSISQAEADKDFDTTQARVLILKYLYLRNPKLARRLIAERQARDKSPEAVRAAGFDEESRLPGKLAGALLDTDPRAAAGILEQHLTRVVTMESVASLARLREKNFLLADYIAAKSLEATLTQPTLASLPGLQLLGAYVFAGAEAPLPSIEADYSRQALQHSYFATGLDVLRVSLSESPDALRHLSLGQQQFRAAYQAELAATLAALAFRIRPSMATELGGIATRLAPQVPERMPRLSQTALARVSGNFTSEDPEQRFGFALSSGDFDLARSELERIKDSERRNLYSQVLIKSQVRALLARSEFIEAVAAIRNLEDRAGRLVMYLDALKSINPKRNADVASIIINEARLLIPPVGRNGLHLRALLAFSSQSANLKALNETLEFLTGAVTTINALSNDEGNDRKSPTEAAWAELNDPDTLLSDPEMERAFSTVGLIAFDAALTQAKRIQPKAVQLMARLQSIQGTVKLSASRPKRATVAAPATRSNKPTSKP